MKKVKVLVIILLIFSYQIVFSKTANIKTIKLVKCVDGDTAIFKINNEEKKVRFLAINTKETKTKKEAYGKEASDYTCNELTTAKKIQIQYDDNSDKTDKYGRDLGWIFVDGKLLQEKLVSKGYAEVKYIYGDYLYTDKLLQKEKIAKEKKLGIWSNTKKISVSEDEVFDNLENFLNKIVRKLVKRIKNMI